MTWLTLASTVLGGLFQPVKDYLSYKKEKTAANRDLELARIAAEKEAIISQNTSDTSNLKFRLEATSKEFKQNTFWLLCVPVAFSVIMPSKAEAMWHNFGLMPEYIQWLFLSVYSSIWGIPVVKGGYGAITEMLQTRRDYKLEKQKEKVFNEALYASELRNRIYKQGMTQEQWDNQREAVLASIK